MMSESVRSPESSSSRWRLVWALLATVGAAPVAMFFLDALVRGQSAGDFNPVVAGIFVGAVLAWAGVATRKTALSIIGAAIVVATVLFFIFVAWAFSHMTI